jgi:hypothetical protein
VSKGRREEVHAQTISCRLKKEKLKEAELYDGQYLVRSNLSDPESEWLWKRHRLLGQIEAVSRCFKNGLRIGPVFHQIDTRVEAHPLACFQAFGLSVTLQPRLRPLAPGLTPAGCSTGWLEYPLLDVGTPNTNEQVLRLTRYSEPEKVVARWLQGLGKALPDPR